MASAQGPSIGFDPAREALVTLPRGDDPPIFLHGLVHKHAVVVRVEPEYCKRQMLAHLGQHLDQQALLVDQRRARCVHNIPTTAPLMQVASVPDKIDRRPSATISARRSGTIAPIPPIRMPRLPKLAK